MSEVKPDAHGNWLRQTDNDFDSFIPIASKETKAAKTPGQERAIFKLFSLGVVTNRDDWVYGDSRKDLATKVAFLIEAYNRDHERLRHLRKSEKFTAELDTTIKWTRAVKKDLRKGIPYVFNSAALVPSIYRPFVKRVLYYSRQLNEMLYQMPLLFGARGGENIGIAYVAEERVDFALIAVRDIPNKDMFMPSAAQVLARYFFDDGTRLDNITDWALEQFRAHYEANPSPLAGQPITKDAVFHYVYGVLHDPVYREKYAQNLKREFPRIPFYPDFWRWAGWGEELMRLHIGYENIEPWPLARTDAKDEKAAAAGLAPKPILKADKEHGIIVLDSETQISGVPREAFDYRLGNRCALEWILDQYKEKTPKDPTIREKFNTYRFAGYKEKVVDLLARVTRVSVETQRIVAAMKREAR